MNRVILALCIDAVVIGLLGCASTPSKPNVPPPGYSADVTPGNDGSNLIGGAP